ncbi:hypothetical protein KQI52_06760 [bacterium]|nr:hypothetical protein [bacterium]
MNRNSTAPPALNYLLFLVVLLLVGFLLVCVPTEVFSQEVVLQPASDWVSVLIG